MKFINLLRELYLLIEMLNFNYESLTCCNLWRGAFMSTVKSEEHIIIYWVFASSTQQDTISDNTDFLLNSESVILLSYSTLTSTMTQWHNDTFR